MKEPTNKLPVNPELAKFMDGMSEEHVILLTLKIMNPDEPLWKLAEQVWPEIQGAARRKKIHASNISRVIQYIAAHPYQLALLLNSKLMPLAIATLYEGLSAKKENVRVTAAKEIIRLGQTTIPRMSTEEDEDVGTGALDTLLAVEGEYRVIGEGEGDGPSELRDADSEHNSDDNPGDSGN